MLPTPKVGWDVNMCNQLGVPKHVVGNTAEKNLRSEFEILCVVLHVILKISHPLQAALFLSNPSYRVTCSLSSISIN